MLLYDVGLILFRIYLSIAAFFNKKIRAGIEGRKGLLDELRTHYQSISPSRSRVLVHVSSYGELEQAKPVIEAIRAEFPGSHIHLSFFSPSGYLNTVNKYPAADLITYLPFDTKENVRRFLDIAKPDLVLFARYDVWHNLAREIKKRNIASLLFSATFSVSLAKRLPILRNIQRTTYNSLTRVFCVSETDKKSFELYGVDKGVISVAGDTRYDQVIKRRAAISERLQSISANLESALASDGAFVIVAGSTWESDESVIGSACEELVTNNHNVYLVIAPHEVGQSRIVQLLQIFKGATRLSSFNGERAIIVDSIGKLFQLYRYASVAYVGGGFGHGLHNVLEPAAWGVPVVVGPKHDRSQEVALLLESGAAFEVADSNSFAAILQQLFSNDQARKEMGQRAKVFVDERQGACNEIISIVKKILTLRTSS